jgi:hypothetical protein
MSTEKIASARQYVKAAALPEAPPVTLGARALDTFDFDAAKEQATVVGSDVIAFVKGVTPEQRSDVVNATLLAQLVARKKVPDPKTIDDVVAWYDEYFDVLSQVGFVVQDRGFSEYEERADTFEAHQAILEVVGALMAGSPVALAIVKKMLESLQKMSANSPWVTLFSRESQHAKTARFQVSLVNADENAPFLTSIAAFGLEADAQITQVLFFKFHRNTVKLRHHAGKVTIDPDVLAGVRSDVADKLQAYTKNFVAGLDL